MKILCKGSDSVQSILKLEDYDGPNSQLYFVPIECQFTLIFFPIDEKKILFYFYLFIFNMHKLFYFKIIFTM